MITIETRAWQIAEHPDADSVFEWIRRNWHDLNEHSLYECIDTLKALAERCGYTLDYSISTVPDRGEHVTFVNGCDYDRDPKAQGVFTEKELSGECPLTGVCWDENALDAFREASPDATLSDVLETAGYNVLNALHRETEYCYSDEGLRDMCDANGYYFKESGAII